MKKFVIALIIILLMLCFIDNILSIDTTHEQTQSSVVAYQQPIDFFFLHDCSGSSRGSIEMISSSHFNPLLACTDRDIRIGFLCITSNSAQLPVFITLIAKPFSTPVNPDLTTLTITERKHKKEAYLAATQQYEQDSVRYYSARTKQIELFSAKVDSMVALYRDHFTRETDLATSIAVADKSFNSSDKRAYRILCINSDGQDSYGRTTTQLHNNADVLLINADRYTTTSIDRIITNTFTTIEQAINYSLQNNHQ